MTPAKRMLTTKEAAEYCGFASAGGFVAHIPVAPVKFGKLVRYDRVDLDAYLDDLSQFRTSATAFEDLAGAPSHRGH